MAGIVKYLRAFWKLLRFETYLLLALHALIGFMTAAIEFEDKLIDELIKNPDYMWPAISALVLPGLWYVNGTSINDLSDYEIDQINLAQADDRPLVSGQVNKRELWRIWLFTAVITASLSLVISPIAVIISSFMILLSWAYSMPPVRISYRGGLAPALLPIGYVVYPLSLGWLVLSPAVYLAAVSLAIGLYFLFVSRVMLKDFRDVEGDKQFGKLTFLLRHNVRYVCRASMVMMLLGVAGVSWFAAYHGGAAVGAVFLLIAWIISQLLERLSTQTKWQYQRAYLPYIGRLISLISLAIVGLLLYINGDVSYQQYLLASIIFGFIAINLGRNSPIQLFVRQSG